MKMAALAIEYNFLSFHYGQAKEWNHANQLISHSFFRSWHSTGAIQYCQVSHATFDSQSNKSTFSEAMAYRGDLIGCEVDFGGVRNGKLPVMFFLNSKEIARAWTKRISGEIKVFPFISMAYEGIRVLAKV